MCVISEHLLSGDPRETIEFDTSPRKHESLQEEGVQGQI